MNRFNESEHEASYRRGVVLGFTVAEVILLVLFALLLALGTLLLTGRDSVQKADAINHKFAAALDSLNRGDKEQFIKRVSEAISEEIDYQKKLEQLEKKLRSQSLPDDVYAELRSSKIDLSSAEGKNQFLDLLSRALEARKSAADKLGMMEKEFASLCQAGSDLKKALGPNADPSKIVNTLKDTKGREEYWKNQAAKCGLAGNLPPCYKESNDDPTPYIFDARIKESGILLSDTVPEKYRERLKTDFVDIPPTNKVLTDSNFRDLTYKFLQFGQKNQCRFYVTVYDDIGNDKQRLKEAMKTIESNFYKRITW